MLSIFFDEFWAYTVFILIQVLLKLYLAKLILIWSSLTAVIAVGKELLFSFSMINLISHYLSSQWPYLEFNAALVFSFTAFFIYEQYESELDGLAMLLFNCTKQLKSLLTCNLPAPIASFLCNLRILHKHNTPNVVKDRQWLLDLTYFSAEFDTACTWSDSFIRQALYTWKRIEYRRVYIHIVQIQFIFSSINTSCECSIS